MTTPVALRKLAAALRNSTGVSPGERSKVMHSVATSLEYMARRLDEVSRNPPDEQETTMSDRKGDKSKQPPECEPRFTPSAHNPRLGVWSRCPNLKETGGGMDGERYGCAICGESYFLDYDEMR